jgi:hypothetical protein
MGTEPVTFTTEMKAAACSTCFCIVRPGEQVTLYTEHQGSQDRQRVHHDNHQDCQEALARESVRYARLPNAAGDGIRRYRVTHGDRS